MAGTDYINHKAPERFDPDWVGNKPNLLNSAQYHDVTQPNIPRAVFMLKT